MAPETKKPETKTFPVTLLKHYRPLGSFMVEQDGELREPTSDEIAKTKAGTIIHLPIDEARDIVGKKIADRNDAIA